MTRKETERGRETKRRVKSISRVGKVLKTMWPQFEVLRECDRNDSQESDSMCLRREEKKSEYIDKTIITTASYKKIAKVTLSCM